jgi:hypothetical protein
MKITRDATIGHKDARLQIEGGLGKIKTKIAPFLTS